MREGRHHRSASDHHAARDGRWICCPSPTVPAGGSKHRRLGSYALPRTQQKYQVPNDENLHIESKTDSSHTIRWKKRKEINMIRNNHFPGSHWLLTIPPHLRTSQCCWGQRSLVAHSDIPFLRLTSKEQLRTRPRCVCSPLNFSPQPPSPAILPLSTCYGEYLGFKVYIWPQDVPSILGTSSPQVLWCSSFPPSTDPSHCLSLTQGWWRGT